MAVTVKQVLVLAGLVTATLTAGSAWSQDKVAKLTSTDWPPYTGEHLPSQGATTEVVRQAFAAVGYKIEVDFYPWQRAVDSAKSGSHNAYFPDYSMTTTEWVLSESVGTGPLGLAEMIDKKVTWETLADLKKYKVGTVLGYINTTEFDAMAEKKELTVDGSADDATNLRKLIGGRVDLAVVDSNVLQYLLQTDAKLADAKGKVQMNPKLLEDKTLHLIFNLNSKEIATAFSEGLKKIDAAKIMKEYFELNKL